MDALEMAKMRGFAEMIVYSFRNNRREFLNCLNEIILQAGSTGYKVSNGASTGKHWFADKTGQLSIDALKQAAFICFALDCGIREDKIVERLIEWFGNREQELKLKTRDS